MKSLVSFWGLCICHKLGLKQPVTSLWPLKSLDPQTYTSRKQHVLKLGIFLQCPLRKWLWQEMVKEPPGRQSQEPRRKTDKGIPASRTKGWPRAHCPVRTSRLCHPCSAEFHYCYGLMAACVSHSSFSNRRLYYAFYVAFGRWGVEDLTVLS